MSRPLHPCRSCDVLPRRDFLATTSLLALSALTSGCDQSAVSGPESVPDFPLVPITLDPRSIPGLQEVGGRVVITQGLSSPVLVERLGVSDYHGLSLVCPHRGTIVEPRSTGFRCPNHGATFGSDGRWSSGQSTTDLAPVAVRLNPDGTLTIGGRPAAPTLALSITSAVFTATVGSNTKVPSQTLTISNGNGGALRNLQVDVAYAAGQRGGWLSATLDRPFAPSSLTLSVEPTGLSAGAYAATITVASTDASNSPQRLAVSLTVRDPEAEPVLRLSSTALQFSGSFSSPPASQIVLCTNAGGGVLSGLEARIIHTAGGPTGWLTATLDRATVPAELTVRAQPSAMALGTYSATVLVKAAGSVEQSIAVTLSVLPDGLTVPLSRWPALAAVGGVAGPVGNLNGVEVAVARTGAASFVAMSMRCPHQGGTVAVVNNSSFRCPNHGALFDAAGVLQSNSPQRADNLTRLSVAYTPGAPTLLVF